MPLSKVLKKEGKLIENDSRFQSLDEKAQEQLLRACLASPWLWQWMKDQPDWVAVLDFFGLPTVSSEAELKSLSENWTLTGENEVMSDLRVWRNRHMARFIFRDATSLSDVRTTAKAVSDLADAALSIGLQWSTAFWIEKEGEPSAHSLTSKPQRLIVIAMGKHGAQELNLSSDIDLIFAFPETGETSKGRSNDEFFTRVGRKLIHILDARTSDGFVFRVDMRLRPWGQSGALVSNFKSLQNYYLQHGRFWERFALVKARAVTGGGEEKSALNDILQPFVYRRYIDFQAVGALRDLKSKIKTEVRRQNLDRNIKLGRGGIREVEFIAQVFQLIRGGQDEILQDRGTWPVLDSLKKLELLPSEAVGELVAAYDFLRDLEHRIQAIRDEQTQTLPIDEGDLGRLVLSLGFVSEQEFTKTLNEHREQIHQHFNHLISDEETDMRREQLEGYIEGWERLPNKTMEGSSVEQALYEFKVLPAVARLTGVAKQNFDEFMPLLWAELDRYADAGKRFMAIRPILESILRRSSYFTLLSENHNAIVELVKLVPASPWIATALKDKPFLLDELTDRSSLYQLPNRSELRDELHQLLLRVPEDDLERQMEILRHFRHGRALRAAACEVTNLLPLMKISDYLAWVAEVVVEQSLALVWRQMVTRHGRPSKDDEDWCDTDFGVIAYGKMGGIELSYESDLDLVFLHAASPNGSTEGPKVIENVVFMARLGQKLIHLLSSVTPSGMLYEVDTRLRPSGNSGLLVSSLSAFEKYQAEKAWTWEHQALVRARFIAGDLSIKKAFDRFRDTILSIKRTPTDLQTEVYSMRQKMRDHLSTDADTKPETDVFHIKHDRGGVVDLEFIVQYLVLLHAAKHPALLKWSDNVRLIQALQSEDLITEEEKQTWLDAYLALRQEVHHSILDNADKELSLSSLSGELIQVRASITRSWQKYLKG